MSEVNTLNKFDHWKRNIILFLSSQTISLFGSSLVQYAIFWQITLETGSGIMMTVFILCGFIPTFLLSPFAGVWADRYNRKMLIILADSLIALATLMLAIIFLTGYKEIWLLFVMAAVRALGTGIQMPAVGAILPQIVPGEQLTKVNGINGSIQAMTAFVSPMVSAALLTFASLEIIFFVDVITAAIAISVLLLFLKIPTHQKAVEKAATSYFNDLKEGIGYISGHGFLKRIMIFFAIFFVFAAPAAFLTPLQVTRTFGPDEWRLMAIELSFSLGMMLGGALIASWGGFRNRIHTMTLGIVMMGITTLLLGIVPNFWLYLLIMLVCGVSLPVMNTMSTVLLQEKVEENYLGRIFGVFSMISTSMMPIGMLIFGPIADVIKIEWLLIGTGLVILILCLWFGRNKVLLEAGMPRNL